MDLKDICKFWSLIKMHDVLMCNIIKMMPYNGCSQMLRISLKTKFFYIAHPWCLQSTPVSQVRDSHLEWVTPVVKTSPATWPHNHWAHDDFMTWKHFLFYWPFVGGIHQSRTNACFKGYCSLQWCHMSVIASHITENWNCHPGAGHLWSFSVLCLLSM